MARRRRNIRDTVAITNRHRLDLRPRLTLSSFSIPSDRRVFHPDGHFRRPDAFVRVAADLRVTPSSPRRSLPFSVSFRDPSRVHLCVRRKVRREVLFAKGGAGSRKMRPPRRNYFSSVRC